MWDVIKSLLSGLIDLIMWAIKGILFLGIWILGQLWELTKPVVLSILDWYKAIILLHPIENLLLWGVIALIFYFWNRKAKPMSGSRPAIYKRPKVVTAVAVPILTALLGVLMPTDKKGGTTVNINSGNTATSNSTSINNTNSNNTNINSGNTSTINETNNTTTTSNTSNRTTKSSAQTTNISQSVLQNSPVATGTENQTNKK